MICEIDDHVDKRHLMKVLRRADSAFVLKHLQRHEWNAMSEVKRVIMRELTRLIVGK
jgi:hypothetical protein